MEEILKPEDNADVVEELCDTVNANLFNPFYKPFYSGLTMTKVFESFNNQDPIISSTASGPGNPLKIDCYPSYSDSGTGIYYYHFMDFEKGEFGTVHIKVSLWGDGFWMGDTTQRINSIFIRGRCEPFDQLLPLGREGSIMLLDREMEKIDTNLFSYSEDDYRFWYLTKNDRIDAVLIERIYCKNHITEPAEIQGYYK